MNIKQWLLLFVASVLLFTSCKKEQGESIDYTATTQERIKAVSEQSTISDEDIASLERLLEKVPAGADQTRLATLLESVKLIRDFIPAFEKLRTDPEVNFQETYTELESKLKEMSDELPRKQKLQTDLANALASYSTEEYTYTEQIINGMELGTFLADNHNLRPIEGKPRSYLKKDIEAVDSLFFPAYESVPFSVIKTFKGLEALTVICKDETLNLNHLKNLEYLNINYGKKLVIDSCQQLKHLEIVSGGRHDPDPPQWGETLDFTDKYPLLETLILPENVSAELVTILLPNKQHLTYLGFASLSNIKTLVIEGNGIYSLSLEVGSESNKEIEEVRITGVGRKTGEPDFNDGFYISGISDSEITTRVKIKKLTLSTIESTVVGRLGFMYLNLDKLPDLSSLLGAATTGLEILYSRLGKKPDFDNIAAAQLAGLSSFVMDRNLIDESSGYTDYTGLLQKLNPEKLESIGLTELTAYPNKTVDMSRFKKLNFISLTTATVKDGQVLNKLILNKALEGNFYFNHTNAEGVAEPNVQVEFK